MSTRERWIVYPLLFLTLGIVMRDKVARQTRFEANEIVAAQIRCNQLRVDQALCGSLQSVNGIAAPRIQCGELVAGPRIQCGELAVLGPNGRRMVFAGTDARTNSGLLEIVSPAGAPLVRLLPTDSGLKISAMEKKDGAIPPEKKSPSPSSPSPKSPSK